MNALDRGNKLGTITHCVRSYPIRLHMFFMSHYGVEDADDYVEEGMLNVGLPQYVYEALWSRLRHSSM
ncbi:hypothetical protein KIN20_010471 [Parelaphostrongylus tenuis]|uniref:Uncharacterized protein n=1 Tax=Parelaphostrongylus tenuis TaxID=148309 RepID=A0AAD5QK99_PARTN|nr:hypothetical protein KIN20_010471 [Parelaphostrongylus tenuis]